jgi:glycosyltransferase involved in cell wall biosynthesis
MRFCLVTTFYPPFHFGGDALFVRNLAHALNRRGHHVEVVHCEDAYRLKGAAPAAATEACGGIAVHRLRSRLGTLSPLITHQFGVPGLKSPALRRILDQDFDVVNFHNVSLVGGPGALALSRAPVTLFTLHEHWLICPTHILWKNGEKACDGPECFSCSWRSGVPPQLWRYTPLMQWALRHVDLLLSPSGYTAQQHRRSGIETPIRVLPTFTPLPAPPVDAVAAPGFQRPRFVYAGRVTASKGVERMLRVFARLPDYDLVVAGEGDLAGPLRRQYEACSWIRFLGVVRHEAVETLYRGAAASVLPAIGPEVFPLSVLESLAAGTPAIVSDAGGAPEAVEKSGGGVVFRDEAGLEAAVRRLADDAAWRRELGQRGRRAVEEYYNESRYVEEYLEIVNAIRAEKS